MVLKSVDCLLMLESKLLLLSGTAEGKLRFWKPAPGHLIKTVDANIGVYDTLTAVATTEDNSYLLTGDSAGNMQKLHVTYGVP